MNSRQVEVLCSCLELLPQELRESETVSEVLVAIRAAEKAVDAVREAAKKAQHHAISVMGGLANISSEQARSNPLAAAMCAADTAACSLAAAYVGLVDVDMFLESLLEAARVSGGADAKNEMMLRCREILISKGESQ